MMRSRGLFDGYLLKDRANRNTPDSSYLMKNVETRDPTGLVSSHRNVRDTKPFSKLGLGETELASDFTYSLTDLDCLHEQGLIIKETLGGRQLFLVLSEEEISRLT